VTLADLRRRREVTQARLAAALAMSQSDLSKAERRSDLKLSTLRALVGGLGLELRVSAIDPATGEAVELAIDGERGAGD
jgi:transcriptional regulator with XRE-family HTH domain